MYTEWIAITAFLAVVIVATGRAAMKDAKNFEFLSPPSKATDLVIAGSQAFPTPTPSLSESTPRPNDIKMDSEITDAPMRFHVAAMVAKFAELLRLGYRAREGNLRGVETQVHRLHRLLPDDTNVAELGVLASIAPRIQQAFAGS